MVEPTHFAVYGREDYGERHYLGDDPAKCPLCNPHLWEVTETHTSAGQMDKGASHTGKREDCPIIREALHGGLAMDEYEIWKRHEEGNCVDDCPACYHDSHEHGEFVFGLVCLVDES